MTRHPLILTLGLLLLPLLLVSLVLALLGGSLPNTLASPLALRFALLPDLFASNVLQTLKLVLFDLDVLALTSVGSTGLNWGVYWSISDVIGLLVAAVLLARPLAQWSLLRGRQKGLWLAAALLCWSALFEMWLRGCCSGGPDWWPEVLLLVKAYGANPYVDTINWQGIYQKIAAISALLRGGVFIAAMLLLRLLALSRRQANRPPQTQSVP
ncbi:MAG: hypothetical protein R6X06_04565 [Gammaproteobacteria bacterium]